MATDPCLRKTFFRVRYPHEYIRMANHATQNIIVLLQKYMIEYNIQNLYVNL
jgi:hypothetical protein